VRLHPAALGITLILAVGFTAVGETVLGRRSRDLRAWNESFLAGAGICAAALFPLSLLLPRSALRAELALIAACFVVAVVRHVRHVRRPAEPPRPSSERLDATSRFLVAAILLWAAWFAAVDLRYNMLWDGLQIWASKAQLLFYQGALAKTWYPGDTYELRHVAYPALVPLYEALLSLVRGPFDFDAFKPIFLPFYASLLVATFGAARAVVSTRLALVATLLVALVPQLSTGPAAGGYADLPQAAFVAGVASAALRRRDREALPWLIGGLTTVKSEGTILAAAACGAVVLVWLLEPERRARFWRSVPWPSVAIVAVFFGLRLALLRWVAAPDMVYVLDRAHLAQVFGRIPEVARLCLVKALSPRRWGLFWPAFFASGVALLLRGSARDKSLAVATAATAIVLATVFLFSTWPLDVHIDQAYPRLLAQIAPAAAVVIVLGYDLASRARPDREAATPEL
jgi:hypothetical protein